MGQQSELQFAAPCDLERFNIPRSTPDIRYGHVSRHLRALWRAHPMSLRKRTQRDKREPIPDFDQPAQPAGIFHAGA